MSSIPEYDDRCMMAHEAETIIPGSFVVLQGSAGDGMSDTVSTCPLLPDDQEEEEEEGDGYDDDDDDEPTPMQLQSPRSSSGEFHHVENTGNQNHSHHHHHPSSVTVAPGPLLGQLATQKRTATTMGIMRGLPTTGTATATTTATSGRSRSLRNRHHQSQSSSATTNATTSTATAAATATDDYIVVTDDQASEPSSSQHASAAQQKSSSTTNTATTTTTIHHHPEEEDAEAIEDWKQQCRMEEIRNRKEFRECLHQTASALMDHTLTKLYDERDMWWQSEGRLCIFRDLPTKLHNGTVLRSLLGTISPGTTIVATDIVYLNSQTLTRIAVNPILRSGGMAHAQHNIYPKGRMGWIQMVRVENHHPSGRSGYICLSLDGYPLMAPGLPSLYADPHVWIWRVACPAGAYVREGLALLSAHLDTLPYGSLIRVTRRTINTQGLSRLMIHAMIPDDNDNNTTTTTTTTDNKQQQQQQQQSSSSPNNNNNNNNNNTSSRKRWVNGWISEFLNPQSGQRGIVAQPLTFPIPALYRVTLTLGAVIRSDIELSSPQIGIAPLGSVLPVVGRAFSEHPSEKCLERLQLAGNGGWISVRLNRPPPHDDLVVEFVAMDDTKFHPDTPGEYHLQAQRAVRAAEEEHDENNDNSNNNNNNGQTSRTSSGEDLSSIDSGPSDSSDIHMSPPSGRSSNDNNNNNNNNNNNATTTTTTTMLHRKTTTYHRRNKNGNTTSGGKYNNKQQLKNSPHDKCLICLTEERNATIVHGETGHVACCLVCARILKARGDKVR
jgi:hypothetical protein